MLAFDYRGFGKSTGTPTEEGLIIDGVAILDWALNVAKVPAENIVIFGHSLGTAVATAVVEHYADNFPEINFAALVLLSGFSDIPNLMKTYMIGGVIPVLSPLGSFPLLERYISAHILDPWDTATRITRVVEKKIGFKLHILHAKNDMDINWKHSDLLYNAACRGLPDAHVKDIIQEEDPEWVEGDTCMSDARRSTSAEAYHDAVKHRSIKLSRLRSGGKWICLS